MPRRIETLFIDGPAGRLEALLEEPEDREPVAAALVSHPHPQHGGTMHNKVVYRIARGLRKAGLVVLRYNFRGVNLSEGEFGHWHGERDDAAAALGHLRGLYPDLPYLLAGFSFGARISLQLACSLPDVEVVLPVGFPTRYEDQPLYTECGIRKHFIASTNDIYAPREHMDLFFEQLPQPKEITWVEAQDHFFAGSLEKLQEIVENIAENCKSSFLA